MGIEEIVIIISQLDTLISSIKTDKIEISRFVLEIPNKEKLNFENLSFVNGIEVVNKKNTISFYIEKF